MRSQEYKASAIPDSLLENAIAVKRLDDYSITIKSIGSAIIRHKYAMTILNEAGDAYAQYRNIYNQFVKLKEVRGRLYDAKGKLLKSVKQKDMRDHAYENGNDLFSDARIKSNDFFWRIYPYTVEYEDEEEYVGIYVFPSWVPRSNTNLSVQTSSFYVEMPTNYNLRYKSFNGAGEPIVTVGEKTRTMKWEAHNLPALPFEELQPTGSYFAQSVMIGPDDFEYGGYKGNMSSWDNYARFYATLYKGRDVLPDAVKKEVHSLIDTVADKERKVKLLYKYLQHSTHYISIQLGIGGLQPFEAKYVAEKKYGDCKALSNYMVSLLKEAGIQANQVVIYGGDDFRGVTDDFPTHYFNHVVVCVPDVSKKDSIWLECTSQTQSPGYMGTFTGNRKALFIGDNGGVLVNTPFYTADDNVQIRRITAVVDVNGNLSAKVITKRTGIEQEEQHYILHEKTNTQQEDYLNHSLDLPTYKVETFSYTEKEGKVPVIEEILKINVTNYASVSGKRIFIQPNLLTRDKKLSGSANRISSIEIKNAYQHIDTVTIRIPEGYAVESMPQQIDLNNKYGIYKISFKVGEGWINCIRKRESFARIFPSSDFVDIARFYDLVYKSDRAKLVLVKKDG